ncbi:hypothetical protein HY251_06665 [bacterium]|nr:hypothetical protein [bacterium]
MKRQALAVLVASAALVSARARADDSKAEPAAKPSWSPSEAEAENARHELAPAVAELGDARRSAAPAALLESLRKRATIPSLVSLVSQPTTGAAPADAQLAVEVLAHAGKAARSHVARALESGEPGEAAPLLLETAARIGDEGSVLETPLIEKMKSAIEAKKPPTLIIDALGKLGTRKSFRPLAEAVPDARCGPHVYALCQACEKIVGREKDPDAILGPLLDEAPHLERARLVHVFPVLGHSRGAALGKVSDLVDRIDTDLAAEETPDPQDLECLSSGLAAQVAIGTKDAFSRVTAFIERTHVDAHRSRAILALMGARPASKLDAASALVDAMAARTKASAAERSMINEVLLNLTGELHGEDLDAWRRSIEKLRAAEKEEPKKEAPEGPSGR